MASSFKRRILTDEITSDPKEIATSKAEEVHTVPISKIKSSNQKPEGKRRNGLVFFLGGLVGIIVAGMFARNNDLIELPEIGSLDSFLDVLPANVVQDARDLIVRVHC